eukprot:CAMPEP_0194395078 /NCGR_PEP_ID=MMETSP0174-20130528/124220_1 /TAXON_ID=216777 /ORGANISM="Proboscia alata, Strain PI-D3" /LENGTH=482 /DNA_ID=CAMNT_0039190965 /DNA_START=73 /DNA_END=1521 /DNA_ORIENTATION=+
MTKLQIQLLNEVGFEWNCSAYPWKKMYDELVSYKKEFGHTRVSPKYPQNPSLGNWVARQRAIYKQFQEGNPSSKMTENQVLLLNTIGFEWNLGHEGLNENKWNNKYEELLSYVKMSGNTRVPPKFPQNPKLGNWVNNQRRNYKQIQRGDLSSSMTKLQIQLLNKVGFEWNCSGGHTWQKMYGELVSYKKEFGHTKVFPKYPQNPSLGNWAQRQRSRYKQFQKGNSSSNMTENQVQLLNEIGFEWDLPHEPNEKCSKESPDKENIQKKSNFEILSEIDAKREGQQSSHDIISSSRILLNQNKWNKKYEELLTYVKMKGHAQVPPKFPQNPKLGNWVHNQRRNYKQFQRGDLSSSMTKLQIQLLNEVGFEWNCSAYPWKKMYDELVSYKKEFGHTRVSPRCPQNPSLGNWVQKQRSRYTKFQKGNSSTKMTENQAQLLNAVGFEWDLRHKGTTFLPNLTHEPNEKCSEESPDNENNQNNLIANI